MFSTVFAIPLLLNNHMATFKTANQFSIHIEKLAAEKRMSHLDAILNFCEQHTIDPADVASKINKSLKEKIEQDFRELNYLPKQAQLDL